MALSQKDEQIVVALHRYYYLTVEQVCALFYSLKSISYVNKVLSSLAKEKYLNRMRTTVNAPFVYSLGRRGAQLLKSLGKEVYVTPSEHNNHTTLHLRHALAVSDFLIAAEKLPAHKDGCEVVRLYHDLTLKKMLSGRAVPDGFIEFRREQQQICICLELDRGTEDQTIWRAKIRAMVDWISQFYTATFETQSLNIAVATIANQRRAEMLQSWTEKELGNRNELQWFLFTSLPPGALHPVWLFFEPIWWRMGKYESIL